MELIIRPEKVLKFLTIIVICLSFMSLVGQFYKHLAHDRYLVTLFNLDLEWNIPTWYSSITLLFSSILLSVIASVKKTDKRSYFHWRLLSIIFLLLAMDEAIQFHEQTITPLRTLFNLRGIFYYSWVIPGIALLLIFVLVFLKFLANLPKKIRLLFIVSGALYVGGAIGMELIGGYYAYSYTRENIIYSILTNLEEIFEMTGILIFIYMLLSYIALDLKGLRIGIQEKSLESS